MYIFSWDWFGDCNDRIMGHPNAIDTMVKYDEDTLITGAEDGLVRAVSVHPNSIVSILGDHNNEGEEERYSVSRVAISCDGKLVASASHDDIVKIFDIEELAGREKGAYDSAQEEDHAMRDDSGKEEDDGEEQWEDESSSSEEEEEEKEKMSVKEKKRSKKLNVKGM